MNVVDQVIVFRPRFWPRGLWDLSITIIIGISLQFVGLFIVPAAVALFVFGSAKAALLAALLVYVAFLLLSVWSVSLSHEGIRFKRVLGGPKLIPWSELTSVTEVSRSELISRGWLWPLIPAREMTACLSSLGHYKIAWRGGFCYYPPADAPAFESTVNAFLIARDA
jgi:hypothetical protein